MRFDLNNLFNQQDDPIIFIELEKPFTEQEIDNVIKELPNDKSPGPDGFNNEFFKACWDIIGPDVKRLLHDFYEGNVNLESINTSYITLIPKVASP